MLADDTDILMADLLSLGFAVRGTYTYGGTTIPNIICAFDISAANSIENITGQSRNESASLTVSKSQLSSWSYGGKITVASGPWAGEWTISAHTGNDDSSYTFEVTKQRAEQTRSPGVRRLIGE